MPRGKSVPPDGASKSWFYDIFDPDNRGAIDGDEMHGEEETARYR